MSQSARNIDRLTEAMKTLDELAIQEKDEIRHLLSNRYQDLKKTLHELEPEVRGALKNTTERLSRFATSAKESTQEAVKEAGQRIDNKAHEMPWVFMGISALLSGAAGYYLGSRFSSKTEYEDV